MYDNIFEQLTSFTSTTFDYTFTYQNTITTIMDQKYGIRNTMFSYLLKNQGISREIVILPWFFQIIQSEPMQINEEDVCVRGGSIFAGGASDKEKQLYIRTDN